MFDTLTCDYPLPDREAQTLEFQTKSLACTLDRYVITSSGRLMQGRWRDGGFVPDHAWPFHGDIRIFGSLPGGRDVEYVVRFTHGRVEWVHPTDQVAVADSDSSEAPWLNERLFAADLNAPVPGIQGRRLTREEFVDYAPDQLELVDGWIPGGEGLLRLLLTSLGLRSAVRLGGAERWKQVIGGTEG
jgi:hypothetical protein